MTRQERMDLLFKGIVGSDFRHLFDVDPIFHAQVFNLVRSTLDTVDLIAAASAKRISDATGKDDA